MKYFDGLAKLRTHLSLAGPPARFWFLLAVSVVIWAALAVVFWHPVSIHDRFLNDAFVFIDGIDRIADGQVPHVDFSTPVGALSYWMLYIGYSLVGGYGGAVEVASLVLAAATLFAASVLMSGRVPVAAGLLILGTIAGIIVVPLVPGWSPDEVSNSMHYNRWGWGVLIPVFLLGLAPSDNRQGPLGTAIRVLCAAALFVALFYIKITYFLAALAVLPVLLLYRDARRLDGILVALLVAVLLVASALVVPGILQAYLADIKQAISAGGSVNRDSYLSYLLPNRHSILLFALAVYASLLPPRLGWRDYALPALTLLTSLVIIDQNFQFVFLVGLMAGFALLVSPLRHTDPAERVAGSVIIAAGFVMLLPFAADWARVTLKHVTPLNASIYHEIDHPQYSGVFMADLHPSETTEGLDAYADIDATSYVTGNIPLLTVTEKEYLGTLVEGADVLRKNAPEHAVIVTFDYTNTLAPMVDAAREPGWFSWLHFHRNLAMEDLPSPDDLFASVDYVMIPKVSRYATPTQLLSVYGDYIAANLKLVEQSPSWLLYSTK